MELLYSPRGKVFGASYTDVVAHLPALNLLILISLFGAVLLLVNIKRRGWLLPATAISLWLAVSIIVGGVVPAAIQRFRDVRDVGIPRGNSTDFHPEPPPALLARPEVFAKRAGQSQKPHSPLQQP